MKLRTCNAAGLAIVLSGLVSCGDANSENDNAPAGDTVATATADTAQASAEWVSLFDGKTFNGWHGFNRKGEEIKNWAIEDGALVCLGAAKDAHGGDLATDKTYSNFEMEWDWKVTKGANSGVIYHAVEDPKYKAPYETGPEYQVIDDIDFPEKLEDWQEAGADYAIMAASKNKKLMPVGEWNNSRLIYNNGHVEHWLNGEKVVEFERSGDMWKKQRASGKWKDFPDYAKTTSGVIALQDHGNKVYFKNIRIREL